MQEPSREEIWKMFDQISVTYDRVNRFMTFGLDLFWRKKLARFLPQGRPLYLLDGATGTGDQIFSLLSSKNLIEKAVGIDLSKEMLALAEKKCKANETRVSFQEASLLFIPFEAEVFDCVTLSFGIRNVTDVNRALTECFRVLKSGGRLLILEGSLPQNRLFRMLFLFHLRCILPLIGKLISKNRSAYRYLNQTIETFPCGQAFCSLLRKAGFAKVGLHPMTFGSVTLYIGEKG
jgi:demethylmenaquinone methyltransferase / 2-methoxy-6-polyprenyl-1,4-benzoquinol methylase